MTLPFVEGADNLPTMTPISSSVKAISTLPIPLIGQSIKSYMGCVIYLAQIFPKLSKLIKPINGILKNCTKVDPADRIQPSLLYAKGKVEYRHLIFKSIGWRFIPLTLRL